VLGEALLGGLRDVFLTRMGDPLEHLPETRRAAVSAWAEQLTDRSCTRALEAVGDALRDMRQAPDQRIPLEVALVRITRADTDSSLEGLAARLDRLERAAAAGGAAPAANAGGGPAPATPAAAAPAAADPDTPSPAEPASTTRPAAEPAPPAPSGNARPADAARAQLSGRAGSASGTPAPPRSESRPGRAAPRPATPPPAAPGSTGAERPAPAAPAPEAPAAAPDAPPSAGDAPPDRDTLTLAWGDVVLPGMKGMAKALYSAGRFLDSTPTSAVFALENEVHRKKCEEKRTEVEAALGRHFGRPVPLRLVVDEGAVPARQAAATPTPQEQRATDEAADVQLASEIGNVHELDDAPADNRSHVDRLAEAFPGSEIVPPD
jgi:DNA polymerase-3 subunit gamma/tau